ncbi:DNA repair protein RadA [Dichanthelium oligosanthes]|uniref:DNA repair protein RadA n=1 Tax=Dichanthelium oligosanthes TaxID=888268 RepID=A0A1E5VVI1_9POAL|nr:DNA repair protein RadA [Dichanthelium oligosanthes]
MLRSPSSLRSLIRLSGRLLRPPTPRLPRPLNHRLPCHPLSTRPRFLSTSSSPAPGGAGWAIYDPLTDTLSASAAALPSHSASPPASDSEAPAESEPWGVFDPVLGRIVMQGSPPSSSSTTAAAAEEEEEDEEGEEEGEGAGEVKGKRYASARGGKAQTSWSSVAAARKPAGKGGKERVSYVCSHCKEADSQWWGICRHCRATGTLEKYVAGSDGVASSAEGSLHVGRSWIPQKTKEMVPQSLQEGHLQWLLIQSIGGKSGSFGMEIARVLGGGIVPGSLILVGGDPGVGKSSLMLQLASNILESFKVDDESSPVVYVSGEESIEQIGNRADRMSITSSKLYLYSGTDIEDILDKIQPLSPRALIIDSIQTVYIRSFAGSAGNLSQVKECTSALLRFAKLTNIPVFLIGHVTKSGDIAGPRLLEHIVDVVLYMEGERCSSHRLLRSVKNRFGSTDEVYSHLGVFEMAEFGLQAVLNPSQMFLTEHDSDSEILAGLAVAVILDGSRTFAIEVQALCVSSSSRTGQVVGIPPRRADVIISVLMKQAGLKLQDNAIFLNVVSGFELTETAGDLAIAASICSSFLEFPIPNDVAFIGEVGLGGELRTVPRMDKRVMAIAKLGYKKCVVPKTSEKLLKPLNLDIKILPCSNLKQFINAIFRPQG